MRLYDNNGRSHTTPHKFETNINSTNKKVVSRGVPGRTKAVPASKGKQYPFQSSTRATATFAVTMVRLHHHNHNDEPSESSETALSQNNHVTFPFSEDSSYVYAPIPIPPSMKKHKKRPSPPLVEEQDDFTEGYLDEEDVPTRRSPNTSSTRADGASIMAWISRRLYTNNCWRFINTSVLAPCTAWVCSSRSCRSLYQKGHLTPLGRDTSHVLLSICMFNLLPMFLYFLFDFTRLDVTFGVYVVTMIFLITTAFLLLTECICASMKRARPPSQAPSGPEKPASAIICAYLPTEAEILVETVQHFLNNVEYEPGIQIIVAYNTPIHIPAIEEQLELLANRFPNLLVLCVKHSVSRAQNINAALDFVVGDFVGVFNADERPAVHSFSRAWRWLSVGYDVVQGHGVSRNAEESWMARMMAVEAECRAVYEPGRYTRDGVVFCHSNAYWKSSVLKRIGMLASMLNETVDAGIMALGEGRKIGMDPHLISRNLSTTTAFQTWNQRLRLSQGWFQVSMRHCFPLLCSPSLGIRQKIGIFLHLNVREMFPWFSSQVVPLVVYWILSGENRDLIRPLLLAYMTYLIVAGPVTALAAYCLCHPTLRNPWWFVQYSLFSSFVYMNALNLCARVGHIKQALGETAWRVTPRSTSSTHIADVPDEPVGQTPKETVVKAIGEPGMTVMTLQKVTQSTTLGRVVQESRATFQKELEQFNRSRHHFSRQEDESVMIASHKLHCAVKRCDWTYSVSCPESPLNGNTSQCQDAGPSDEEVQVVETNLRHIENVQGSNKRRIASWIQPKRVSTVDRRRNGSTLSQSSDDSRGNVSIDWSFQSMFGDYSVSVQPIDYNGSPADHSIALSTSDESGSIQTSDMSRSRRHPHKSMTTRFQKVFNLSSLLSGSVSTKNSSDRSSSSSLYSDYSRSIDETGPGAFWPKKPFGPNSAYDQSSSTIIIDCSVNLQEATEVDLEVGQQEHSDVQRIRAQNQEAKNMGPEKSNTTFSSCTNKGFSLDPPSSSLPVAAMSFRPDPPLKTSSVHVEKGNGQSDLTRQPVKEKYWKKRGRYWAKKNDKSSASSPQLKGQHRIGKDPEASCNPQKRRHRDAPSELGRIYTIEESHDDHESQSEGLLDPDEMSLSSDGSHADFSSADPPANEMPATTRRNDELSGLIVKKPPCQASDDLDIPSSLKVQSSVKTFETHFSKDISKYEPAEPPEEFMSNLPHRDANANMLPSHNQHLGKYGDDNEVGSYETVEKEFEPESKHSFSRIPMNNVSDTSPFTETNASIEMVLNEVGISTTMPHGHTSNFSETSLDKIMATRPVDLPVEDSASDERRSKLPSGIHGMRKATQERSGRDEAKSYSSEGIIDVSDAYSCSVDDSSLDHAPVESASRCSSSCTSYGPENDQEYTGTNANNPPFVNSIQSIECNDDVLGSHVENAGHDSKSIIEISSTEKSVCDGSSSGQYKQMPRVQVGEGGSEGDEHLLALQQMIELEMDRDMRSIVEIEEIEAGSSLNSKSFPTPFENTHLERRTFFKELSNAAPPDELSEGVSARHEYSTSSNGSCQSEAMKRGRPSPRIFREQAYLPFRPPVDIEVDHEASLCDSNSNADTLTYSRSQSYTIPYSVDIEVGSTDENSSVDFLADEVAEDETLLDVLQTQDLNTGLETELSALELTEYDLRPREQMIHNLDDDGSSCYKETTRLASSEGQNQDDAIPVGTVLQKETRFSRASQDNRARQANSECTGDSSIASLEVHSDPPGDEKVAFHSRPPHGNEDKVLKRTVFTNVQLSASQSTTDEESVVSDVHEHINEIDDEDDDDGLSTSWIQNLLDTMDEEIIFCDTSSPLEVFGDDEIPDLMEADTLQTLSTTQSYDEATRNRDDWLADEVSTVDLTVN